ncbi:MAG: hypothetical protein HC874_31545 [Richelia sp. SL_2_1]|nr:hypothetical protein [Richelia sp. SL_2_1]
MDTTHGFGYQVSSIHKTWLQTFQVLLKSIGINSKLSLSKESGLKDFNDGYGLYNSSTLYRITISQSNSIKLSKLVKFSRLVSFADRSVSYTIKSKSNMVVSITDNGIQDYVYCCGVKSNETLAIGIGIMSRQCGEINLRDMQLCNLSSVICREEDTPASLMEKIRVATIIGSIQAMATNFNGFRHQWKQNCEEERLLGVDLNGQMDCPILVNDNGQLREELRDIAVLTNKEMSEYLGINPATAVTCVKPNGNSSQLLDCASGMHPRYSEFYIRNVRVNVNTPVYKVLFASGVPLVPENGQTWENMTVAVASFPVKSPHNSITRENLSAIDLLEFWRLNKEHYTEHNPSATIYYRESEKDDVKNWIWNNKNIIGGITLLPYSDAKFNNMPYVEITEDEYIEALSKFPDRIKWELLSEFELEDMTTASQELACSGGHCIL